MKLKDKLVKAIARPRQACLFPLALAGTLSIVQVNSALAQAAGGGATGIAQPIITILQQIQSVMLGPLGVSVFVIGLIAIGMACLRSVIPWGWLVAYFVGSAIAFGAPEIVNTIQSAVGGG
jgi:type IV secretion system protein VirB2